MRTAVIRVDSSRAIGSGHLMRCLTLAGRLSAKDYDVHFICRDLDGNLSALVERRGFKLHLLPRHHESFELEGYGNWLTVPQSLDADEVKAILNRLGTIDLLVVDSYAIDIEWEAAMRPLVEKIFVIDDLANRRHDCDVLLDQNFHLNPEGRYDGLVPAHCELRIGPKHALLRAEFYEAKKHLRQRDGSINNILIFYGGIDLTNETSKAMQAVVELVESDRPRLTADVVVGGSNPHKLDVEEFCNRHDYLRYHCQVDNMAELMNGADLALCAGGTTTWERLFMELPSIMTAIADNQSGGSALASVGFVEYLGRADEVDVEKIVRAIRAWDAEEFLRFKRSLSRVFQSD
ncbi:MAG: UDP-2,4-diacetamido-2,4,6-trideoxy-beta-L-altropyranose hydrolase [Selenomonadaceae bacterium]|nr:UDP-2,4-diacetamido-2,4,6-trideoxy-beta-L-altropyranose hydrolase [Selenomonadaceae bacterium]